MADQSLMSIKQLAGWLGISTDTVRRAVRRGQIPFTREQTAYRFDPDEVRRAMRARAELRFSRRSAPGRAPGGASRPRADAISPRLVKRGRSSHNVATESPR